MRADARLCALPEGGGRRVYGARFAPRDIWRARRGQAVPVAGRWREVAVVVRGRERTRQVWFGVCRRWGWGRQVFGCLIVRGRKGGGRAKEQAPMAFLVASGDGDVSELPWGVAQAAEWVWQRWECEVSFREMKSGFGLGEKPCWGRR
ncbi:MAG: hypothetical protein NZM37_13255, partial [Sandaracinaceae bacterium]|nr:hypothetical protein [Sandaracinaceae bacterium]